MINYAIIGGGRLARHFSEYFRLLEIPHTRWARDRGSLFNTYDLPDAGQRLKMTVGHADYVLLLVPDKAITSVLKQYPFLHEKQLIHCSGSMSIPGVAGVHPLMTFADELYELDTYQNLPFIVETGSAFEQLFPALPNPHYVMNVEDKCRYHAMCVMAGNFSQVLWKAVANRFEQQLDLPAEVLQPYLVQVAGNFIKAPESALTGPLVRGDQPTIDRNISSLGGDPLQDLYSAFVHFYQQEKNHVSNPEQIQMERVI